MPDSSPQPESTRELHAGEIDLLAGMIMVMQRRFMPGLMGELSRGKVSFAQFFLSPLSIQGLNIQRHSTPLIRNSLATLFLGSYLMVVVDLIVDPVASLGKFWFLGDIYHYPNPGVHFGVTFANYCGWFVVAFLTLFINQRFDLWLNQRGQPKGENSKAPAHRHDRSHRRNNRTRFRRNARLKLSHAG